MDVSITVIDRHFEGDNDEGTCGELRAAGKMKKSSDSFVVTYKETVESPNDCETTLKIEKDRITMIRCGRFRTSMIFESGKRHSALYETPFGKAMIGIYTHSLFIDFDKEGGQMNFAYSIDCNGDLVSENELKIFVEVK